MELGILPFYPGNSPFYAIWDAPCYLATCVKLFGTYHILHRVGGAVCRTTVSDTGLWMFGLPRVRGSDIGVIEEGCLPSGGTRRHMIGSETQVCGMKWRTKWYH